MRILFFVFFLAGTITSFSQQQFPIESVLQKGHARQVECMAFSPDGRYLATGSYDFSIKLWDIASGKEIRTFSHHTLRVNSIVFSKDGKYILSASSDNTACVVDILTGTVDKKFVLEKEQLVKACFSPLENYVMLKDNRSDLFVWNRQSQTLVSKVETPFNAQLFPEIMSPDETKILEYDSYKGVNVVNVKTKDSILFLPFDKPYNMYFSPDGTTISVGSIKLFAEVFNATTGVLKQHLVYNEEIRCEGCNTLIRYSNNSKLLLTSSGRTGINLWNVQSGKLLKTFLNDDDNFDFMAFSPDDSYVLAQRDDETFVWDVSSGKLMISTNNEGLWYFPDFSKNNMLATASANNTATVWSVEKQKKIKTLQGFLNKARTDGLKFQQSSWFDVAVLNVLNAKPAFAVNPNGKEMVKGKIDSIAYVIHLETGQIIHRLTGHSKQVIACQYSPDGTMIATAGGDGDIRFWDTKTGNFIRKIDAHSELIFDIAFSRDGNQLASASWDGSFRVWDVKTGAYLRRISLDQSSPLRLKYTPQDLYILCSDNGKNFKLWETDSGEEFRKLVGHTDFVFDFDFDPDGTKIVSAGKDGKVKIWDLLNGMQIGKYSGHIAAVNAVAWDPLNRFIASGGNDKSIRLIDSKTCKEIRQFNVSMGAIAGLQFTKDGNKLISVTTDGVIQIWDMNQMQEIYTYIQIDRENWLSKTPSGHFDGSAGALKHINYVSGLSVIAVDALFEKFYSPKLIQRIMSGEVFKNPGVGISEQMKEAPGLELQIGNAQERGIDIDLDSIVWYTEKIQVEMTLTDNGGGLDELRIYNNSKLIQTELFVNEKTNVGKTITKTFELPIQTGENKISAVALNKNRVESQEKSMTIYFDGLQSDIDLYILAIGVDKYQNPSYQLSYALNDAKAYLKEIDKGATPIFKTINKQFLKDEETTKAAIKNNFDNIATVAGPEDVFLFYFAGHGTMSMGNDKSESSFYLIPYDVTKLYGDDQLLADKAISANELLEYSKKIKAGKQLFVLDACQSGGALEAVSVRGASREKAIAQLARSTGTFFLLASGAVQFASEAKELGHGLFTYAILEALTGKADGGSFDKKITANELKSYVEDRVPELSEEYMLTPQFPTGYSFGQDFPIVILK